MRALVRPLRSALLTVLVGGFLSATLTRYAPGFAADEERLDTRRSAESLRRLQQRRLADSNVATFYLQSLRNYLRGDLGFSHSLARPVRELVGERYPTTLIAIAVGLTAAWMFGLAAAIASIFRPHALTRAGVEGSVTLLQCLPAALIALLLFALGGRGPVLGGAAIALVLYPRIASYARGILQQAYDSSHVLMARARGLTRTRVFLWHAVPASLPQLLSFAGMSISLALSAAIPMEVILDTPGIGQLAWQAALARDMSLLLALTILFSLVIISANTVSDVLVGVAAPGERSS